MSLFGIFAAGFLVAALVLPPWTLLVGDFLTAHWFDDTSLAGVRLALSDVALLCFAGALVLGRREEHERPAIPWQRLWWLLVLFLCGAYLVAPMNQQHLTDPVRALWQLLRYAVKPVILYPLTVAFLARGERLPRVLLAIALSGAFVAFEGIEQGSETTQRAGGVFRTGNYMSGALLLPVLLSAGRVLFARGRAERMAHLVLLLVMLRGFMFGGSRGAFVGLLAGGLCLGAGFWILERGRFVMAAVLGVAVLIGTFVIKPDLLERPRVARLLSASEGTEAHTFVWRLEQRWPHFLAIAWANPVFGVGTDVDESLSDSANTPHNGYISIAVKWGIPVLVLVVSFAGIGVFASLSAFLRDGDRARREWALLCFAGFGGFLTHNLVEATFLIEYARRIFLLLVGVAVVLHRMPELFSAAVVRPAEPEPPEESPPPPQGAA